MNDYLILSLLAINTLFLGLILFKVWQFKHNLKFVCFVDTKDISGLVKKQKEITLKGQIFLGEVPIGAQYVLSTHKTEFLDQEKLDKITNDLIKPLAQIGIKVITKKLF